LVAERERVGATDPPGPRRRSDTSVTGLRAARPRQVEIEKARRLQRRAVVGVAVSSRAEGVHCLRRPRTYDPAYP
jgi:hypothetical protein